MLIQLWFIAHLQHFVFNLCILVCVNGVELDPLTGFEKNGLTAAGIIGKQRAAPKTCLLYTSRCV